MEDKDKQEVTKPRKNLTEIFNKPPVEPRITEPDPNYDSSVVPSTSPEVETQEELFRAAAVRCAIMEEQLASLLNKIAQNDPRIMRQPIEGVFIEGEGNQLSVSSYIEDIKIQEGHNVSVQFHDGIANHAKYLGINTNRELHLGLHTDEASRKLYEALSKSDPIIRRDVYTLYYFTEDGEYKKSLGIPPQMKSKMDKSRRPLLPVPDFPGEDHSIFHQVYESEMLAGDFEIAGKALQMLIDRLTPLVENKE